MSIETTYRADRQASASARKADFEQERHVTWLKRVGAIGVPVGKSSAQTIHDRSCLAEKRRSPSDAAQLIGGIQGALNFLGLKTIGPHAAHPSARLPPISTRSSPASLRQRWTASVTNVTAPRITTSDVLLTGLAYCENCGGALMLGTGKSGRYRYYGCSSKQPPQRQTACTMSTSILEPELDALVLEALADQLMTPERLTILLREALRHRREMAALPGDN